MDSKQRLPAGQEEEVVHPVGGGCLVHRAPHKLALLKTIMKRMMIMQIVRKFVMVVLTI